MPDKTSTPYSPLLPSLAIGGYRSFGAVQRFPRFRKINVFIGQNNCGKSNVLRFIAEKASALQTKGLGMANGDSHRLGAPAIYGLSLGSALETAREIAKRLQIAETKQEFSTLKTLFEGRAGEHGLVWFDYQTGRVSPSDWSACMAGISDAELQRLWSTFTGQGRGNRGQHWEPEVIQRIQPVFPSPRVEMIPAFRRIGIQGSESDGFDGTGIISRLAKLQHPGIDHLEDKRRFEGVRDFVRAVLSNPTAQIDIPHERDTIHVELDGKTETIESLGTGLHEVIILAAASTVLDECVICMEEPELHLNPLLQKKLMRYLVERTSNQYFIATHSAALMDTADAEVYHLSLIDGATSVERVTSDRHRSAICADLGYHPSDLLQSNSIIWVEGPSYRVYLQWWIAAVDPALIEGIHYSIMFYGGRLASHLTADDDAATEFIQLRRLNRQGVIMMDSDRASPTGELNATKLRLQAEFDAGPGHAFITAGREVENYIEPELLKRALDAVHPELPPASNFGEFENALKVTAKNGTDRQADKVRVAHKVRELSEAPAFDRLDLLAQVKRIVAFIRAANPPIEPVCD